uniref:Uncharacterized protein n=1 Tax=Romanomermis culicivorax TaxID=13658 RepID=A0A915KKV8_ROMCU
MHSVTATYIISYVHAFVYLSLFVYQLIVAINVSIEIFGAVVYIPCILTSVFVLGSIGSTILTTIAIPKKEYDWLDYLSYFIYASILYSTYLWVFTILPFEKEYEWLDFMRVQLESKPRLVTGMLEQNSTWQDFQSDSMSLRTGFFCFLYSGLLIFGYSSILFGKLQLLQACYPSRRLKTYRSEAVCIKASTYEWFFYLKVRDECSSIDPSPLI